MRAPLPAASSSAGPARRSWPASRAPAPRRTRNLEPHAARACLAARPAHAGLARCRGLWRPYRAHGRPRAVRRLHRVPHRATRRAGARPLLRQVARRLRHPGRRLDGGQRSSAARRLPDHRRDGVPAERRQASAGRPSPARGRARHRRAHHRHPGIRGSLQRLPGHGLEHPARHRRHARTARRLGGRRESSLPARRRLCRRERPGVGARARPARSRHRRAGRAIREPRAVGVRVGDRRRPVGGQLGHEGCRHLLVRRRPGVVRRQRPPARHHPPSRRGLRPAARGAGFGMAAGRHVEAGLLLAPTEPFSSGLRSWNPGCGTTATASHGARPAPAPS
jgi:hypothetical protein